jgi:PPIC-type PPIASE domain
MASIRRTSSSRPAASGSEPAPPDGVTAARSPAAARVPRRRLWTFVRGEPLVHFALLGGLLFAASTLWPAQGPETIVIDRATVEALVQQQGQILGRPPSEAEQALLVQGLVDDAVLLREAYRRGLEQDAVVERHLVQKMRFVLGEEVAEPSEAELRDHFAATAERYRNPPTVSLDQVFYEDPGTVPEDLLERLRAGADFRGLGDRLYMLGPRLARYSAADLADLFGDDLARRIFELPAGVWQGPFRSPAGAHLVRVAERQPASVPAFEEVRDWVREDWRHARQQAAIADQLTALRERYRIVVEGAGAR